MKSFTQIAMPQHDSILSDLARLCSREPMPPILLTPGFSQVPAPAPSPETVSTVLPCPFCGALPEVKFYPASPDAEDYYMVHCENGATCPASPATFAPTRPQAIANWNTRAPL